MKTYEQRIEDIEDKLIHDDWIGVRMDMRPRKREKLIKELHRTIGKPMPTKNTPPTPPEPMIITDIKHPEGVPEFILELERDVYKDGYTSLIGSSITVVN